MASEINGISNNRSWLVHIDLPLQKHRTLVQHLVFHSLPMTTLFLSISDFQASSVSLHYILNHHVIRVDPSNVLLLRRRIGGREAIACDLPFTINFSEDEQLLISLVSFTTTFDDSSTGRVGTCIMSAARF